MQRAWDFYCNLMIMKKGKQNLLEQRKSRLQERLEKYNLDADDLDDARFDPSEYDFVDPVEIANRILILLAVAVTAYNFDESEKVMDWLKKEQLWTSTSENEKLFFRDPDPSDELKQTLSWRFEAAYMLAWALEKVQLNAHPSRECGEPLVADFMLRVPPVGTTTDDFFEDLEFRSPAEIIDESIFYDNTTAYFKAIEKDQKENTSPLHQKACIQRQLALKWIVSGDAEGWDEITG